MDSIEEKYRDSITRRNTLPVIIEVAGMPRCGKTTFADAIIKFLKRADLNVKLFPRATDHFLLKDKWSSEFSIWSIASFVKELLEAKNAGFQVIVADRGLFDTVVWLNVKRKKGLLQSQMHRSLVDLAMAEFVMNHYGVILAFSGENDEIIERTGNTNVYGTPGSVQSIENLDLLRQELQKEALRWNSKSPIVFEIETSGLKLRETLDIAAEKVLTALQQT